MKTLTQTLLLIAALVASANQAEAQSLVYEGFNGYTVTHISSQSANSYTVGLTGTYTAPSGLIQYTATGLTFDDLNVSGGALKSTATSNSAVDVELNLAAPLTGTVFTSYLVNFTVSPINGSYEYAGISTSVGGTDTLSGIADGSGLSTHNVSASYLGGSGNVTTSSQSLAAGQTYMVLSESTNVGSTLSVGSPGVTTTWVLSTSQFTNLESLAGGVTVANLNSLTVGTASNDITSVVSNTATSGSASIVSGDYLQIGSQIYSGSDTITTDEIRLGTSLANVVYLKSTIGTISATPASASIITGGSTAFSVTVANGAAGGTTSNLSAGATAVTNVTGSISAGSITAASASTSSSVSGLTFNGATVGAAQAGSFTVSDPNSTNSSETGSVTVNVYGHASGSLSSSTLTIGNLRVGYASPVTSSNSITASNASGYLVNLSGSGVNGNVSLTSVSGVAAGGTSGSITATLATGQTAGAVSTPVTYTFADNSALSGASSNDGTASVTITGGVYDYANPTYSGSLSIGNIRVGASASRGVTDTVITNASYQDSLDISATNGGNAKLTVGNPSNILAGNSGNVTYTANAAGSLATTSSLGFTSNANGVSGLSNSALTAGSVAITGAAYDYANPTLNTVGPVAFGNVHEGGTATGSISITNTTITNASYQDSLDASATANNGSLTGNFMNITAGNSGTLTVSANTSTAGSLASTVTLGYNSNDNSVSGLTNKTLTSGSITTTGQVYSGLMTWGGASGGTWVTDANWNDSTNGSVHAAPGLDAGFTSSDTATFGSAGAGGTVDLANTSPSLKAVTFNDATSYNLTSTGSGNVVLNGTGSGLGTSGNAALVTITTGNHTISAPVSLTTDANIAVASVSGTPQQLTISGQISGSRSLTTTGTGTTILTSANTYSGGTTVNAGTLYVNGGTAGTTSSGTGSGAVTVNSGGTLAGNGNIDPTNPVTINAGGTLVSGGAQTSAPNITGTGMSFYNTNVVLSGTGTGALSANLTFNLGANNGGNVGSAQNYGSPNTNTTYMSLSGSSTLNFTINSTESISLVDLTNGTLSLRSGTPYLLVDAGSNADYYNLVIATGSGPSTTYSLSQYDASVNGFVVGVYTGGIVDAADATPISILQYGPDGTTPLVAGSTVYNGPSLYLDAGQLEVVPEPGTWALMIGGLALLVFIQRRNRNI